MLHNIINGSSNLATGFTACDSNIISALDGWLYKLKKYIFFSENGPTLEQDTSSFFNHILALVIVHLVVVNQGLKNF